MLLNAFWADVPGVTVLLILAGMVVALTLGFVLSPSGRPAARHRRSGGFSRALANRADRYGDG